jgi:hypothetical protein
MSEELGEATLPLSDSGFTTFRWIQVPCKIGFFSKFSSHVGFVLLMASLQSQDKGDSLMWFKQHEWVGGAAAAATKNKKNKSKHGHSRRRVSRMRRGGR